MIYVSKKEINQVEYLIEQSTRGNHVLFDTDTVRRVFEEYASRRQLFSEEQAYSVEHHIERLIGQPSLAEKKAYLEGLDAETYDCVVRTYFNIVENKLYEDEEVRH